MIRLERSSSVAIPAGDMWRWATSPEGINAELWPLLRMTMPRGLAGRPLEEFPVGAPAGRSWLLLFGVLPVDYDDLCVVALEPGRRFLERSRMLSLRPWEHERVIEPAGPDACTVTDRLGFELRRPFGSIPGAGRLAAAIVAFLFRHRHRRLAKLHGAG